jgi:O-antigen/teichoic acid export membrane protein
VSHPRESEPAVTRTEVARGAGLAGLAKSGSLIEVLAQPIYIGLFGLSTYGIYVVLWGAVNLASNLLDLGMTSALQRMVPTADGDERAHATVKASLLVSFLTSASVALAVSLNAESISNLFNVAPADQPSLPFAITLFVWALPLWTFIEVATSAARARRAFGPEIRLRIFWEQIARILFALAAFAAGFQSIGLMVAHLASLALTALLCVRLLGSYYDLRLLVRAPIGPVLGPLIKSGLALLPSNLTRRLLIDAPAVVLNLMIPGARGADAAGLFEIARKISTMPTVVRQAFQYVLAPLSSSQAHVDRSQVAPLYHFASRVSTALVVPMAGLLIFAGPDILSVFKSEVKVALPLLIVLVSARAFEALVGPAATIVEMTGHRLLPLLNSLLGVGVWVVLTLWLVPGRGAMGMAIAIAAATLISAYAATIELQISDRLSPFGYKFFQGLGIALVGVALMWGVASIAGGPVRFVAIVALWLAVTWLALRYGLTREDRIALGGFGRKLRLPL